MEDKEYTSYSVCNKPADNKLLHWFLIISMMFMVTGNEDE